MVVGHSVYEIQGFASCLFERNSEFQKLFLFRLEIRKDWRKKHLYMSPLGSSMQETLEKSWQKEETTWKILPATDSFIIRR